MACSVCSICSQIYEDHQNIIEDDCVSTKTPIRCWGCSLSNGGNSNKNNQQISPIPLSLYMEDKASNIVYKKPSSTFFNVNWNQSSDRPIPHIQNTNIHRNTSSLRGMRTSLKPGAISPGGIGVDIKHNSFYRYNLRIRGAVLKTNKCCNNPNYK